MKTPVQQGTSAAKAGWLILLLLFGWLAFVFVPLPWKEAAEAPPAKKAPLSKLQRVGLRDYTDWEGLPEIFTVWADKAEWKDGRTRFAYWHPVTKTYAYFFEATQVKGGYRFKEIAEPQDQNGEWDVSLGEDCPIRFYRNVPTKSIVRLIPVPYNYSHGSSPERVKLETKPASIQPPASPDPETKH